MAAKTKEIARLMPKAYEVETDGAIVRVPGDAGENRIANHLLAAAIRHLLEQNIKKLQNLDGPMTPKELRDLAEAGKSLAEFSQQVYKDPDPTQATPVEALPAESGIDFSKMTKKDDNQGSKGAE